MNGGASAGYLRDMHTLFDAGTVAGLSDRQLLQRFTGEQGSSAEAAFEALVLRHGPMVMRVCRNTLGQEQADVHDAFQATFLVLVQKTKSIRRLDSVGSWLFGVATRVARRARVEAARRRVAERQGGLRIAATADHSSDPSDIQDLGPLLQAEVERLPDHLRAVIILCYWEGLTHEQAAARLGCPLGTVRSRVARARSLLHRRLSRRGLESVAGVMLAAFESPAFLKASALEIPANLVSSTVQLSKQVAAGGSLARLTSPGIVSLVHNVIGRMFMTKLKTTAVWLLVIAAGGYGLSLAAPQSGGKGRGPHDARAHPEAAKSKTQPPINAMAQYVVEPPDVLRIQVLEALPGRPISGERVVRPDGRISLEFYGDLYVAGLTVPEIKKKLILHLRTYLHDEQLGLIKGDDVTGEPLIDRATGKPMMIDPKDSDRVSVDVKASNSKHYYLQGAFVVPGRTPITGTETVLDAVSIANGLTSDADHNQVYLYRPDGKGGPVRALKIDIDQIMLGDDLSTNYQLIPGDRLVVRPRAGNLAETEESPARPAEAAAPLPRRLEDDSDRPGAANNPSTRAAPGGVIETLQGLDKRLGEVERKLNLILEALKSPQR
jgi:polysaccharide biosynthesis/export protein